MFRITFSRNSRSKRINLAFQTALKLGATIEGDLIVIDLDEMALFKAYDMLLPLVALISNLKDFKGYYDGTPVEPYRFLLKCHFVYECAKDKYTENAGEYCTTCRQKHLAANVCPFHPKNNPTKLGVVVNELKYGDIRISLN
jgi:hypothetical protein